MDSGWGPPVPGVLGGKGAAGGRLRAPGREARGPVAGCEGAREERRARPGGTGPGSARPRHPARPRHRGVCAGEAATLAAALRSEGRRPGRAARWGTALRPSRRTAGRPGRGSRGDVQDASASGAGKRGAGSGRETRPPAGNHGTERATGGKCIRETSAGWTLGSATRWPRWPPPEQA